MKWTQKKNTLVWWFSSEKNTGFSIQNCHTNWNDGIWNKMILMLMIDVWLLLWLFLTWEKTVSLCLFVCFVTKCYYFSKMMMLSYHFCCCCWCHNFQTSKQAKKWCKMIILTNINPLSEYNNERQNTIMDVKNSKNRRW